jgi:DNA repair protein RecO (recombination protein O)
MSAEKTRAIILRVIDFSETSCVLTLFTEDFGKIGALAKGARRPKGPFEGAIDLLALARIVLIRKSSDSLDLLTEAKLQRRFRSAERSLARLYAGYYVAELLSELTEPGDPHRQLFQAADATLLALDSDESGNDDMPAETVLQFEMTALLEAGHLPSLDQCVVCSRQVTTDKRVAFGMTAGGVLCEDCRPGRRGVVSVSSGVIGAMRSASELVTASNAEQTDKPPFMLDPVIQGELRAVMNNYFAHLVGHRLKMSEYLGAN